MSWLSKWAKKATTVHPSLRKSGIGKAWTKNITPLGKMRPFGKGSSFAESLKGSDAMSWLFGEESMIGIPGQSFNPKTGTFGEQGIFNLGEDDPMFTDPYAEGYTGTQLFKQGRYEGGPGQEAYGGYDPRAFTNPEDAISAIFGGAGLSAEQKEKLLAGIRDMMVDERAIGLGSEAAGEYKTGRSDILRELLSTGGYKQAQAGGEGGYAGTTSGFGTQKATDEMRRYLQPFEASQQKSVSSAQSDITDIIAYLEGEGRRWEIDMPGPTT